MFLVFDFDGTLADTRRAFRDSFDEAAKEIGAQSFRVEDEQYLRTLEAAEVLRAHGIEREQFPAFTHRLKEGMEKRHGEISLFPGLGEVLDELVDRGLPIGLITSNSAALVKSVLIFRYAHFTYLRFDVPMSEKDAALMLAASECSSQGSLHYVGDEIRDLRAALKAQVGFTGVTWGFNTEEALRKEGCEDTIHQPTDLLRFAPDRTSTSLRSERPL